MRGDVDHFGAYLQKARQERGITIADLSRTTRIQDWQLERLEGSDLDRLPAEVFVVGFIKAYAQAVGADASEALRLYRAERAQKQPVVEVVATRPEEPEPEPHGLHGRRLGVALVVFLILIVATLTLSLLLRHGSAGGGLS
jgi:cytoskeletal protein RodZ